VPFRPDAPSDVTTGMRGCRLFQTCAGAKENATDKRPEGACHLCGGCPTGLERTQRVGVVHDKVDEVVRNAVVYDKGNGVGSRKLSRELCRKLNRKQLNRPLCRELPRLRRCPLVNPIPIDPNAPHNCHAPAPGQDRAAGHLSCVHCLVLLSAGPEARALPLGSASLVGRRRPRRAAV
jgi:hypothetical protein